MHETFLGRDFPSIAGFASQPPAVVYLPLMGSIRGVVAAAFLLALLSQSAPAEDFLQAAGFPSSSYQVLNVWTEADPGSADAYLTGYRLSPRTGGPSFDLYRTSYGELLDAPAAAARGLSPKLWDAPGKSTYGEPATVSPEESRAAPKALTALKSLTISGGAMLPELDLNPVLAEDAARTEAMGKGPERIGVFRDLDDIIHLEGGQASHGFWQDVPGGGTLWSAAILSPDASGIRVHFAQLDLPPGAYAQVYHALDSGEVSGPYTAAAPDSTGLWAATCFTDTAVVECFVPEGESPEDCLLTIDRIVHNYISLGSNSKAKSAGTCNNDVTCYSGWSSASKGVGGIGSIGDTGSLFCTGCLIADTDTHSEIPYFLTANHCISSASDASTAEVYWFYQTSSCNGSAPSPAYVPRTSGATLLSTADASTGTDFCLLRLNAPPPIGAVYNGWTSLPVNLGTGTTVVHHPSGDFKRISFGVTSNVGETYRSIRPSDRYHQSSWTSGTTEPGSSGSPLFITTSLQIIGQLWGGPGSCSTSTNLDYFGRFDKSYPLMASYLDPAPPSIKVKRPNTGPTWPLGGRKGIRWVSSWNASERVRIELWRNGSMVRVLKPRTLNDGRAAWYIDPSLPAGGGYVIRIISKSDPALYDESDVPFSLQ
ncbi:MAG: trypsin-like peptidase domain-containing protein [Candidatus Hydrogenedentes bacterium]|nr:trypsin-like peptidase domain-containing protein [Candidatus Hydrogenedentota bacterium]